MNNYKGELIGVLHYINQQVIKDWSGTDSNAFNKAMCIDVLAKIACMSTRNFQLYFKSYLNETCGAYINRIRLEFALQLLEDGNYSNEEIAERIGYANNTAFFNTIKRKSKQTPTEYKLRYNEKQIIENNKIEFRLEYSEPKDVLFLSYIGDYANLSSFSFEKNSWDKLYQFAQSHNLLSSTEEYWGICFDNTNITETDKCRFYACLTIRLPYNTKQVEEIKYMSISPSLYAIYTYVGEYDGLNNFYNLVIRNIPKGYQLSDDLILEHYINSPKGNPADQLITELWIPIVKD